MKLYEITFSPTGGTAKVSHALAEGFALETLQIDLTDPKTVISAVTLSEEDLCILAVPAYGGASGSIRYRGIKILCRTDFRSSACTADRGTLPSRQSPV